MFVVIVVANTAIGIIQEIRSKKTIDSLSLLSAPTTLVIRDGKEVEITLAFTDYSMEQPKKKDSLLKNTDANKRMESPFIAVRSSVSSEHHISPMYSFLSSI